MVDAIGGSDVPDLERLQALVARAKAGDRTALPKLRELMEKRNDICQALGDTYNESLACWIKRYAGDDLVRQEAIAKSLDQLRDSLTKPTDTALERLVIRQIVLKQNIVNYSAAVLAQSDCTHLPTLRYLDNRLEKTTRRLTHLVKLLELLRKSRRKTASPKTAVPTAKQNGRPLVPESRFPTFAATTVPPSYRATVTSTPAQIHDCKAAIRFLRGSRVRPACRLQLPTI